MKPVLDENKPVAVGDTGSPLGENGLGRHGSANFHSDSGDESTSMHHVGISLHGDTVSYLWPLLQSISVDLGAGTKHALVHGLASAVQRLCACCTLLSHSSRVRVWRRWHSSHGGQLSPDV